MNKLSSASLLSHYPIAGERMRLEYQIGSILIWVHFPKSMPELTAVAIANEMVGPALAETDAAIETATKASRDRLANFWAVHDQSGVVGNRMTVWSVELDVDTKSIEYTVGCNHRFFSMRRCDAPDLPEFPDQYMVWVASTQDGSLAAVGHFDGA